MTSRNNDVAVALAGEGAATLALARHGSSVLLRIARQAVAAASLTDAVAAPTDALFHDEQIDGPLPQRLRVLALTLADDRTVAAARIAGLDNVYLVGAGDVPEAPSPTSAQRAEQQLAVLAVRLEMAAVYMRLARG
jgi:hypothetical protein